MRGDGSRILALSLLLLGCPGGTKETGAVDTAISACGEGAPWVHVSAGFYLSCGIREGGCVECWGREDWTYQEYEDKTPETDRIDYGELDVPDLAFASLAHVRGPTSEGWDQHACGITLDGELVCWGKEDGDGATTLDVADPVAVAVDENVTCALDADGVVACNQEYSLPPAGAYVALEAGRRVGGAISTEGDFVFWDLAGASYMPPTSVGGPFVDIGVGAQTCGLRGDGGLTCFVPWGTPDPFGDAGPTGTYTSVCGGSWGAVCAIRTDGRPECWYTPDRYEWEEVPPPDVALTQISCGLSHWCGVTVDGDIACWGAVGSWLDVPP